MKNTDLNQIKTIIDNLDFENDQHIRLKRNQQIYAFSHRPEAGDTDLLIGLTNIIYSEFYTVGTVPYQPTNGKKTKEKSSQENQLMMAEFITKLQKANQTEERLDRDWRVDANVSGGILYTTKGNNRVQVQPGEYVKGQTPGLVHLFQRKEHLANDEVFYFVFGTTRAEADVAGLVRLYFNVKPDGGVALVKGLSTLFNRYQIPFQFKCLNQPDLYLRSDAAVLYLNKSYCRFALEILHLMRKELKPHLRPGIPYFTKKLAPGIAFAENPANPKESFGMSRSRMIAEGIVQAYEQGLSKTKWLSLINQNFKKYQLEPGQLYLNAKAHYPYDLTSLKF